MIARMRQRINRFDPDFDQHLVALNGIVQEDVHSADMQEREVWKFQRNGEGKYLVNEYGNHLYHLATGLVTILPKEEQHHVT